MIDRAKRKFFRACRNMDLARKRRVAKRWRREAARWAFAWSNAILERGES